VTAGLSAPQVPSAEDPQLPPPGRPSTGKRRAQGAPCPSSCAICNAVTSSSQFLASVRHRARHLWRPPRILPLRFVFEEGPGNSTGGIGFS
jgi:hypothetical protein